jgi:hypothetical protein
MSAYRLCVCCGLPMPPSINPVCEPCDNMDLSEPEQPEEHPQSEWKAECENDDVVLRRVGISDTVNDIQRGPRLPLHALA